MAIVPSSLPRIWIPRALCFWRMVVSIGRTISLEQLAHPAPSSARWPAIEQAVRTYLAISAPDLILIDPERESATRHSLRNVVGARTAVLVVPTPSSARNLLSP